jgi:hypothetical protein
MMEINIYRDIFPRMGRGGGGRGEEVAEVKEVISRIQSSN